MSELIFRRAGEDLMRVSLDRPKVSVGRGGHNDVALPDEGVARSQFAIVQRGTRTLMVDASGRGTRVAGVAAFEAELYDGAEIDLGVWSARYRTGETVAEAVTDPRLLQSAGNTVERPREVGATGSLRIHLRHGDGPEHVVPWERGDLTLGSGSHNRLVVADRFASAAHLVLSRTARAVWLRDLGSTNGTFLNGARVREAEVAAGDVVQVGEHELRLERIERAGRHLEHRGLIGTDPAWLAALRQAERVAATGMPVTVFGETGTGKELIARVVHERSVRREHPFVPVNCAALHRELIESELFGHERGAFTGADRARPGAFEQAHTGTLFLDEIGELPLDLQAKLLRILETGEVRRLGSNSAVRTDVRIVAATHVDLYTEVKRRRFREDLYYRLCVFPLVLPPLRERADDLLPLANHFLAQRSAGAPAHLSRSAQRKLAAHTFPGNIRELRNLIQRALCLRSGASILPEHIVFDGSYRRGPAADPRHDDEEYLYLPERPMEELENEIVTRALARNIDKKATAEELGISRTTVIKICQRRDRAVARATAKRYAEP